MKNTIALFYIILLLGCNHSVVKKTDPLEVDIKVAKIEEKDDSFYFDIMVNNKTDEGIVIFEGYSIAETDSDPRLLVNFNNEELTVYFNNISCIAPEISPFNHFLFIPAKKSVNFKYNLEKTVNLSLGGKTMYCSVEKEKNLSLKRLKMIFQIFKPDNYEEVCGNAKECIKRSGILNLKKFPREITITTELPKVSEVFYVPDPAEEYLKD